MGVIEMIISVVVHPGTNPRQERVEQQTTLMGDIEYHVRVHARPHDGEATAAAIKKLADYYGCTARCVRIVSGATSRQKRVEVRDER